MALLRNRVMRNDVSIPPDNFEEMEEPLVTEPAEKEVSKTPIPPPEKLEADVTLYDHPNLAPSGAGNFCRHFLGSMDRPGQAAVLAEVHLLCHEQRRCAAVGESSASDRSLVGSLQRRRQRQRLSERRQVVRHSTRFLGQHRLCDREAEMEQYVDAEGNDSVGAARACVAESVVDARSRSGFCRLAVD